MAGIKEKERIFGLMTKLASRVVGGFLVMMMMSTKAMLVAQWIGLLSAGSTVNSHVPTLVLQAHLSMPKIVMQMHQVSGCWPRMFWEQGSIKEQHHTLIEMGTEWKWEQLMVSEQHSSDLATRPPCTTRGDQTYASMTWAKVEMESWYLDLAIKGLGLC